VKHVFEGRVLGSAKLGFSRIPENFPYRTPFPRRDAVVEIFKDPIQPLSEDAAHTGFPGSHEANQKNSVDRKTSDRGGRWLKPPARAWPSIHRFSRSLRQKLAACCELLAATGQAGSEQLETEWFAILRCVC
jgi:hypothetical protein